MMGDAMGDIFFGPIEGEMSSDCVADGTVLSLGSRWSKFIEPESPVVEEKALLPSLS